GLKHADRLLAGPAIRLDYLAGERVKAITLSGQDQVSGTRLTLLADDLAGLNEGAPLWYKGLQIGQINQLSLDANGNASVALVVNTQYQHLLKRA
ncbi:MlaD family protein, partial [Klebsiella pneumoniae]